MATKTETESIEAILDRLDRTKPEQRRAAFFEALAGLPEASLERSQLRETYRTHAPGPFESHEHAILSPLVPVAPRQRTPEEEERLMLHAAAVESLALAREAFRVAAEAHEAAHSKIAAADRIPTDAETDRLAELAAALQDAAEAYEFADGAEVAARPHRNKMPRSVQRFPLLGRLVR